VQTTIKFPPFLAPQINPSGIKWIAEKFPAGIYELTYQIFPQYSGVFLINPAHAYQIYYPGVEAETEGAVMEIKEK
jgi:hypothetical protein